MRSIFFLALLVLCAARLTAQTAAPVKPTFEYRNGLWFNGTTFVPGVWYAVNGKLTQKAPSKVDSILDLGTQWVIPPFADASAAAIGDPLTAAQLLPAYWREGVFYLQVPGNSKATRELLRDRVNRPGTPEVLYANGSLTGPFGTPFLSLEKNAQKVLGEVTPEKYAKIKQQPALKNDAYWFLDTKDALKQQWPQIMAQKPDLLVIYLLDAAKVGGKEGTGLTPDVAKATVKKAHKAKRRVAAYVETVDDLRLALKLKVDAILNLPGYNWNGMGDSTRYALTDADVALLAKRRTPIALLLGQGQTTPRGSQPGEVAKVLKRMLSANVNVVMGSNDPQRTIRPELTYWYQLGNLDEAAALRILCEATPQSMFPGRKIGKFAEGYEANFLVLQSNPLENILKIGLIAMKVQQGRIYY